MHGRKIIFCFCSQVSIALSLDQADEGRQPEFQETYAYLPCCQSGLRFMVNAGLCTCLIYKCWNLSIVQTPCCLQYFVHKLISYHFTKIYTFWLYICRFCCSCSPWIHHAWFRLEQGVAKSHSRSPSAGSGSAGKGSSRIRSLSRHRGKGSCSKLWGGGIPLPA